MNNETFLKYIIPIQVPNDSNNVFILHQLFQIEFIELGKKYFSLSERLSLKAYNRALVQIAIEVRFGKIQEANANLYDRMKGHGRKEMFDIVFYKQEYERRGTKRKLPNNRAIFLRTSN